jgi:hypothetical protein
MLASEIYLKAILDTLGGSIDVNDIEIASIEAGEAHLGEVGGRIASVSVEFTRPANTTAYTAGDVVSNSTVATVLMEFANLLRINAGSAYIVGARLVTDLKSIVPRFRVHLFSTSTPTVAADNAAHKELYTESSQRLGYFDLPAMTTGADAANSTTSRTMDMTVRFPIIAAAATRSIYAMLETLDAFTPASGEKFTLVLIVDQN